MRQTEEEVIVVGKLRLQHKELSASFCWREVFIWLSQSCLDWDSDMKRRSVNILGVTLHSNTLADYKVEPFGSRRQLLVFSVWIVISAIRTFWISVAVPPNESRRENIKQNHRNNSLLRNGFFHHADTSISSLLVFCILVTHPELDYSLFPVWKQRELSRLTAVKLSHL